MWAESIGRAAVVLVAYTVALNSGSSSLGNIDGGYPPRSCVQFLPPPSFLSYLSVASIPPLSATVVQAYSGVSTPQTMATTPAHSAYTSFNPQPAIVYSIFCLFSPPAPTTPLPEVMVMLPVWSTRQ
ncbi:hypothetical protein BJ165DRAFT_1511302 [Panaeolus papilionaceus]|nr:hypothetical protein BJ165DRAFT_1511302 [Panaeolus papilionaceus]